jgi:hypothetical protein
MIVRRAATALIIDVELPNRVCLLPISYKLILEFLISMDNIFIALILYHWYIYCETKVDLPSGIDFSQWAMLWFENGWSTDKRANN